MCGIFFSLGLHGYIPPGEDLVTLLKSRGPDSYQEHTQEVHLSGGDSGPKSSPTDRVYLTFASSVLSLRGARVGVQPFVDVASGSVLCWNGEAWKYNNDDVSGNDTTFVHERLLQPGLSEPTSTNNTAQNSPRIQLLLTTLNSISGPFSFIFFDGPTRSILCGRDCLGRRSLLTKTDAEGNIIVTSVSDGCSPSGWQEIGTDGLRVVELCRNELSRYKPSVIPWTRNDVADHPAPYLQNPLASLNKTVPGEASPAMVSFTSVPKSVLDLETQLRLALKLRLQDIPPRQPADGLDEREKSSKAAVLYSGGVDCTVLARIAHEILPGDETIDLLNVVFENPRIAASSNTLSTEALFEQCPDRITARSSLSELRRTCPTRKWRLVIINVDYTEAMAHRQQVISLMHPHNTEMDLSIAYALYFAARGQGSVFDLEIQRLRPYTTPARVLISGLGADELFGGYTRHATAFARRSFQGLIEELELDVNRLGKRNLGRDDRVISHWGREVRYPYLDEQLMNWALEAPVWEKCGFGLTTSEESRLPDLEPGKRVLRLLAWKLDMEKVAGEKKRAIQFGARTAKMEKGKKKGAELLS